MGLNENDIYAKICSSCGGSWSAEVDMIRHGFCRGYTALIAYESLFHRREQVAKEVRNHLRTEVFAFS